MEDKDRGVSIVVPTLGRDDALIDSVSDLLSQTHRPIEILIVDQSHEASEQLRELVELNANIVRWHRVDFRGLPSARNYGWQHAKYDVVLFVDDDIRCGPELASQHARLLQLPAVAVVAGGIDEVRTGSRNKSATGSFNYWTAKPNRGFDETSSHYVEHAGGGNFSVKRSVLKAVGGFDEVFQVGAALYEETELCLRVRRAGYQIYFNGRARLTHLAAGKGGCRVEDTASYVGGLGHNRGMIIRRHLRWYQVPVALGRLLALQMSYALSGRNPRVLLAGMNGFLKGWRRGAEPPRCTSFVHTQ